MTPTELLRLSYLYDMISRSVCRWWEIPWGIGDVFSPRLNSTACRVPVIPTIFFIDNIHIQLSKKSKIIKIGSRIASGEFFENGDFRIFRRKFRFTTVFLLYALEKHCCKSEISLKNPKVPIFKKFPEAVPEPILIIVPKEK